MIAGLTGGIASGKSLISDALATRRVRVIDADVIAREIVAPGQPALMELVRVFGSDILHADGSLNRARLRERAFADAVLRQKLNAITHPAIRAGMLAQLSQAKGSEEAAYRLLSVPLLLENGLQSLVDMVVVVDVGEDMQLARAMQRDGADRENIARIMQGQWPRHKRLAHAHFVIDNHGSREQTLAQVALLHQKLTALAHQ